MKPMLSCTKFHLAQTSRYVTNKIADRSLSRHCDQLTTQSVCSLQCTVEQHRFASSDQDHQTSSCLCRTDIHRTPTEYTPHISCSGLAVVVCCRCQSSVQPPSMETRQRPSMADQKPCSEDLPTGNPHYRSAPPSCLCQQCFPEISASTEV